MIIRPYGRDLIRRKILGKKNDIKILIVDDNIQYREAFKRTLMIEDYLVCEAENANEAVNVLQSESPDIVVTDLQMRTPREGLDLIRKIKQVNPIIPIIMISAVGSFEEGAMATKLGASYVIHKSRIEEEIDNFFATIEKTYNEFVKNKQMLEFVESARELEDNSPQRKEYIDKITTLLNDININSYVKSEAYDLLMNISEKDLLKESQENIAKVQEQKDLNNQAIESLKKNLDNYEGLSKESKEAIISAEFLYLKGDEVNNLDFSRNIGFSYSFVVENEAKIVLKKKLNRFLSQNETIDTIEDLLDSKTRKVDLFFHQQLLMVQREHEMDFTIDNVKQTFLRILEHKSRYKPDGLKALGIIILCFGRTYSYNRQNKTIRINNPLNLKGLENDEEVVILAELLVNLQHLRNPYIHPEISEMQKISKLRQIAFNCLNKINKLV